MSEILQITFPKFGLTLDLDIDLLKNEHLNGLIARGVRVSMPGLKDMTQEGAQTRLDEMVKAGTLGLRQKAEVKYPVIVLALAELSGALWTVEAEAWAAYRKTNGKSALKMIRAATPGLQAIELRLRMEQCQVAPASE